MSYARYESYSDSGLQWLGKIPSHWEVVQSRRLFEQRKERARDGDEQLTASQKYGIISQKKFMELENQRVVQVLTGSELLKHIEPNDFVISMRSFQGGLEWSKQSGCVSSAYIGLIPIKHVVPEFYNYLFKCGPYIQALQSTSNLVRDGQALRFENFSQVWLPIIPDDEQQRIANFLDYETAKIDTLIDKQQQLIQLLKEKRQAVISHAVTKGLNPNAPIRDSGVEWLGEVPEHWERKSLNYLIAHTVDNRGRTPPVVEEGIPMVEVSQVAGNGLYTSNNYSKFITPESYQQFVRSDVQENDILFVTVGATFGKTCLVPPMPDFFIAQNVVGFRCVEDVDPKFFMFLFSSSVFKEAVSATNKSSTIDNVKVSDLVKTRVVIPPHKEQKEIASHIFKVVEKYEALATKADSVISLLHERRTALISAAVTGKIDVRHHVSRPTGDLQPSES